MAKKRQQPPSSPTELGLRFGLPIAGLGNLTNPGEAGQDGTPSEPAPLSDGLQAVPGQSGAEGLANLPRSQAEEPSDGP